MAAQLFRQIAAFNPGMDSRKNSIPSGICSINLPAYLPQPGPACVFPLRGIAVKPVLHSKGLRQHLHILLQALLFPFYRAPARAQKNHPVPCDRHTPYIGRCLRQLPVFAIPCEHAAGQKGDGLNQFLHGFLRQYPRFLRPRPFLYPETYLLCPGKLLPHIPLQGTQLLQKRLSPLL